MRPVIALVLLAACGKEPAETTEPATGVDHAILFGDLHVHSTNSIDVYVLSSPLLGGRGRVGPEAHCDFAYYCSQLDFWAITDHQEGAPADQWAQSKDAVQLCNAQHGGNDADADMVTYAGFEWQQSSHEPEDDWGHKNVIFRSEDDAELPARAIASAGQVTAVDPTEIDLAVQLAQLLDPDNSDVYADIQKDVNDGLNAPACDDDTPSPDLPLDCIEYAEDPATLYDKLDEWGSDALVIPHGYTWGAHHPAQTTWEHQLTPEQHDPRYQNLLEIYSGHGSMEEYRTWRPVEERDGALTCPEPTDDYLPCCWQAGELVRQRDDACQQDPSGADCQAAVDQGMADFIAAGREGFLTVDATPADWLDCGECRDCFQPAEGHRPLGSAQASLAMTHFDDDGQPLRYPFGFIGSTDTHAKGPGVGFKEAKWMSDIFGPSEPEYDAFVNLLVPRLFPDWVRQNSYYYSGGLLAVHTDDRSRDGIWNALANRQVYATTGERILVWFDLDNGPDGPVGMGSEVTMQEAPRFRIEAVGSFVQASGCPDTVIRAAPEGFVESACYGECYNPTTDRYLVERIEIVRITPQIVEDEPLEGLIADPLAVLECPEDPAGCVVTFEDPEYTQLDRPALYYARVIQEPTLQLNAANLRCEEDGTPCSATELCMGGYEGEDDDCLSTDQERAWASPIFLTP